MKAVRYHRFGSPEVLQIETVDEPQIQPDEMLVEVFSTTVNSGDCHLRSGKPLMARIFAGPVTPRAKILGTTFSGKVVAVGDEVRKFVVGDEVFGSLGIKSGSHAQFIRVNQEGVVVKKPNSLTHEEAASLVFGSLSGKYFLDRASVAKGKNVLILGAAGGVGSYAVQYASALGAQVTGVCRGGNTDFVKALGADEALDYQTIDWQAHKGRFDIVFDTAGKVELTMAEALLNTGGTYITTVARLDVMVKGWMHREKGKRYIFDLNTSSEKDLVQILKLVVKGCYKPLIDGIYRMDEMKQAHARVESTGKEGAVVVNMKL